MKAKIIPISFLILIQLNKTIQDNEKLVGNIISSDPPSNDLLPNAFDNDLSTEFKSLKESNGWIGLDLGFKFRITKVGWAESSNISNCLLGIFEGANNETFIDSVPIYMISENGKVGELNYQEIEIETPFRYVRYIGPNKKYSIISQLEFYGYQNSENQENIDKFNEELKAEVEENGRDSTEA